MAGPPDRNVDIAKVLRDGQLGTLRWLAEDGPGYDSLYRATSRLFALLHEREVDYVLVGGLAMLQYVDGRNTVDIDLVMALPDLERIPELVVSHHDRDFARTGFDGVTVDILLTSNELFGRVSEGYASIRDFSGLPINCATPEGLVLMKLFALPSLYRQGETARVAVYEHDLRLLMHLGVDVEPLYAELAPHLLATDISELQRIVAGIEGDIARLESRPFGEAAPDEPSPA